jgi:hypothetical protein
MTFFHFRETTTYRFLVFFSELFLQYETKMYDAHLPWVVVIEKIDLYINMQIKTE